MSFNPCIIFDDKNIRTYYEEIFSQEGFEPNLPQKLESLIDTCSLESELQYFIEKNPGILPGLLDLHNGPLHNIVVSQFPLAQDYLVDFAFISRHSMMLQFTFVELKNPHLEIFNESDNSFTADFNKAVQQISDYKTFADKTMATLMNMCRELFATYNAWDDRKSVKCYLVYGRRSMINTQKRKDRWQGVGERHKEGYMIMTYDRLMKYADFAVRHDIFLRSLVTCSYKNGQFHAKLPKIAT